MAAPGVGIVSTFPGNQYVIADGTSFAAPLVAGIAFLMRVKTPGLSASAIQGKLRTTSRDFGPRGIDPFYGAGRVDAYAALGQPPLSPTTQPAGDALEPNPTPDRARALAGSLEATISPEGDEDWFVRDVTEQGQITFTVEPPPLLPTAPRTAEMDPILEVYGPDLDLIQRQDVGFAGDPETVVATVLRTGRYYARVTNYFGSRSPEPYTVTSEVTAFDPDPRFGPATTRLLQASAEGLAAADMNGDGRTDLVMNTGAALPGPSSPDANKLLTFLRQADGSLNEAPRKDAGPAHHVAVGDLNADGFRMWCSTPRPASSCSSTPTTAAAGSAPARRSHGARRRARRHRQPRRRRRPGRVLHREQRGMGRHQDGLGLERAEGRDRSVGTVFGDLDVADISGEGRVDIVAIDAANARVWRQNEAKGFPSPSVTLNLGGNTPEGLEIADVTGDALADIVVGDAVTGDDPDELRVFPQDGAGGLSPPTVYPTAGVGGKALESFDLNGDGRMDLVRGPGGGTSRVTVFEQQLDGTLGPFETYAGDTAVGTGGLALGQLTGDTLADIALASHNTSGFLRILPQHSSDPVIPAEDPDLWVRNHAPVDFALFAPASIKPAVRFGRAIDASTIAPWTVALLNGTTGASIPATRAFDAATGLVTITPNVALLADTPYLVVMSGLKDTDGNTIPGITSFRFKTA